MYQFNKVINDFLHFGMLEVAIMKLKEHLYPGDEALTRSDPINIISTPQSREVPSEVLCLCDYSLKVAFYYP